MMRLSQSAQIDAPPSVVFDYATEPARFAEWIPPMVEAHDIVGSGEGQQYEWTYKLAGMLFRGQAVVVEYVTNERSVHQAIGAIESVWTFEVVPRYGGCELSVDIAYEVPMPVLGKLAERVIVARDKRNLKVALANVKEILEGPADPMQ